MEHQQIAEVTTFWAIDYKITIALISTAFSIMVGYISGRFMEKAGFYRAWTIFYSMLQRSADETKQQLDSESVTKSGDYIEGFSDGVVTFCRNFIKETEPKMEKRK